MKQVVNMVKTVPEAARYFKMMKGIMQKGNPSILAELSTIKQQLKTAPPGSKEWVWRRGLTIGIRRCRRGTTWCINSRR